MFQCAKCKQTIGPRVRLNRVVVETRPRIYLDEKQKVIGTGSEIVREEPRCVNCK
jgi:hypothetical protein